MCDDLDQLQKRIAGLESRINSDRLQIAPKGQKQNSVGLKTTQAQVKTTEAQNNSMTSSSMSLGVNRDKAYFLEKMRQAKTGTNLDKMLDESRFSSQINRIDLSGIEEDKDAEDK